MKTHHRNIPYRVPLRQDETRAAGFSLFTRLWRDHLSMRSLPIIVCMVIVVLTSCSPFIKAFYVKLIVDDVLGVGALATESPGTGGASALQRVEDRRVAPSRAPVLGQDRRLETGPLPSPRPPGAGRRLVGVAMLWLVTVIGLNVLARVLHFTKIVAEREITGSLRNALHQKVLDLSLAYHKLQTPGRLLSRITSDVGQVQGQIMHLLLGLSNGLASVLTGLLVVGVVEWRLLPALLVALPACSFLYHRYRPKIVSLNREMRQTNASLYGYVAQKFDAVKAIQAYAREGYEGLHFHRLASCYYRDAYAQQIYSSRLWTQFEGIAGLCNNGVLLMCAWLVTKDAMSIGRMMFVFSAIANLFMPVIQLTQLTVTYQNMLVVIQRLMAVLDEPITIFEPPDAMEFPSPMKRGICLNKVSFRYSLEPDDEKESILDDLTLEIPVGSWLCVMGPSGSGKSTLLYLLTRLYEPTSGDITFDGISIARFKMQSLRARIGFVPQEAQIMSGTVRDNITYGYANAQPSAIMAAAKAAQLHDFIMTMPVQYETVIGEKGISLSGGQRQRLSLSRALLTNPDVLVLDDCTSALDAETERHIQETLAEIMVGKTAIVVSQRVSMAKRCHRIATIEGGRLTELGTHSELLAAGGFYSRLHAQQTE